MRLSVMLIIIFLFGSFSSISDIITFAVITGETDQNYSTQQTADGGYIVAGRSFNTISEKYETHLIKTDSKGMLIWEKAFPGNRNIKVVQAGDSGFYLTSGTSTTAYIAKTDPTGELQWENHYENRSVQALTATKDKGALLSIYEGDSLLIIKMDSYGNEIWSKSYLPGFTFRPNQPVIFELENEDFIYFQYNLFVRFDSNGTELFRNNSLKAHFMVRRSDDTFLFLKFLRSNSESTEYEYLLTDSLTNIFEEGTIEIPLAYLHHNAIIKTADDGFILAGSNIAKIDNQFHVEWAKDLLPIYINNATISSDGGLVFCGTVWSENSRGILLKTNDLGDTKFIILTHPFDNALLKRDSYYMINWISSGIEFVNIDYQKGDDPVWHRITESFPADSGRYRWRVPGLYYERARVRISDVSDPLISDENQQGFSIVTKDYDYIAANECFMWFANNGDGSHDPFTDGNGFYWPGGLNATKSAIFEDGLLWGGYVGDSIRVNGNTHRQGLKPGNIITDGIAADPDDSRFGIWRAKPGWQQLPDGPEKERLQYDWNNWPVDLGAPWDDNDGNGVYDPETDNPKVTGDETFWVVMNDLDTTTTRFTYGADPIGLEIHLQVYAYNRADDLADVVFKKYRIYNKGHNQVDSMFFTYWSDPDLGNAGDDFVGCDTLLNLAYCWNDGPDPIYGEQAPAAGYVLLQGPKVAATAQDSAFAYDQWHYGYLNKEMHACMLYIGSSTIFSDPSQGKIEGSYEFYNNFNGKIWNGDPLLDPNTGQVTRFVVPGDPVNGIGWYEDEGWPGGPRSDDRRMVMSSGPFDFAPGDSQEVVYAIIMAQGENNLDSITELKRKAAAVKEFYYTGVLPVTIEDEKSIKPIQFSLSQNYPNPFNPTTTIHYTVGANNHSPLNVKLVIYDVLGREVKTLVNKRQAAGKYRVTFDAAGLASGIYYYRIAIHSDKLDAGDFVQTKKMLLLR